MLRLVCGRRRRRSLAEAVIATVAGLTWWTGAGLPTSRGGCDFSPANNGSPSCLAALSGSTFAGGDGNLLTSPTTFGTTDWQNVSGLNPDFDPASGKPDNSFGQGTKEDDPNVSVVTGSIPPNKSNLTGFYEASSFSSTNNHNFLYLGWERTNVLGTANFDFEINHAAQPDLTPIGAKTLVRTAGDLLVTYDFNNGGGRPTIGLLRWLTSAGSPVVPGFGTNVCFSANTFPCWGRSGDAGRNGLDRGGEQPGPGHRPAVPERSQLHQSRPGAAVRRDGDRPDAGRRLPAGHVHGVRQRVRQEPLLVVVHGGDQGLHRPDPREHLQLRFGQDHQADRSAR